MARVIYIILVAIVVPLIILVAGKADAETSERKRIEKLMILKKKRMRDSEEKKIYCVQLKKKCKR